MAKDVSKNKEAVRVFKKAQLLAYWSFTGLVIPLAGIVLGVLSLVVASNLIPNTDKERETIKRLRRFSFWGIGISVAVSLLFLGWRGTLVMQHKATSVNLFSGSPSYTINGTESLYDPDLYGYNTTTAFPCEGSGGYGDIVQGSQVVVSDNEGTVLALSQLSAGKTNGTGNCIFDFSIKNVPYSNFYKFQVGHRDIDDSYQQLSKMHFNIYLTLGQ